MINVSISESRVSLDRYLSCYTSVEQMAVQIIHSTDVSFQRPGKFNLTVHVNEKFTELGVSEAGSGKKEGFDVQPVPKGSRTENLHCAKKTWAAAIRVPGGHRWESSRRERQS